MRLNELLESDSLKQDELRNRVRKWKAKSKKSNPKHEYEDVEGRSQRPEYVALGGHVSKQTGPII